MPLENALGELALDASIQTLNTTLGSILTELNAKLETGQAIALDAATLLALEQITATISNFPSEFPDTVSKQVLDAINAKLPLLGNAAVGLSMPVNIANDLTVNSTAAQAVLNTDLLTEAVNGWFDAASFHSATIQLITSAGITAGAVTFEQTNDILNAGSGLVLPADELTLQSANPITSVTLAASVVRMFGVPIIARYVRVRISTAVAGGTVRVAAVFSELPYANNKINVQQATAANMQVTAAASLAAGTNLAGDFGLQVRNNATGAASKFHLVSAATTNAAIVKNAAGRLLGWRISNTNAAFRFVKLHNIATTPTAGTGVVETIAVPPNNSITGFIAQGSGFAAGIGLTTTALAADADSTAVAAGDLIIDLFFA